MNDEIKNSVLSDKDISENEAISENVGAGKNPPETIKTSKDDKRIERLMALKEKYEKAASAQAAATKKANDINAQISKIEREIHAEEIAEIDRLCEEKNLSYKDIALILKSIPAGMTADDVSKLFV